MMRWFAALIGFGRPDCLRSSCMDSGRIAGSPPVETAQAAERLDAMPLELGEWDGEVGEVKAGEAGAGVAGCIKRRYVHRKTGAVVSLFLVCGRPGPVSIHTPEVCYGASGFLVGNKSAVELDQSGDRCGRPTPSAQRHRGDAPAPVLGLERRRQLDGRGGRASAIRALSSACTSCTWCAS